MQYGFIYQLAMLTNHDYGIFMGLNSNTFI